MKILIVDDEPLARQRLRDLLADVPEAQVIAEAADGRIACELADQLRPDVVLLDISMPVMDGLEAARHLATGLHAPGVVFCTAYDEHALAAFEARAVDYLVKPIRRERLIDALQRVRRRAGSEWIGAEKAVLGQRARTHLCARIRGTLRLIDVNDVVYLQAEEKYVVVHHAGGEDLIEDSLKTLEQEFPDLFIRIHRNCLVARARLKELRRQGDGHVVAVLRDQPDTLEVSRRCLPLLKKELRLS
ncbi:MAG TPA: LytTR family DNA-binding domain-containing protein [Aquimonas sp.]|jgi:two-component system, LytTR family, response regulator AlgR|nr:response regulator transcription factor [Xanthomonadales bacterium]HRD73831.1 LytTR family DNA-binding domain-containing protein [Aquimonas sp.]HRF55622.1 LytTR family DNA-binding domain-containing protein [Aquimonas sp.]